MRLLPFNDSWVFHDGFSPALVSALADGEKVSLPHNAVELPFSYFDEKAYLKPFTYQKLVRLDRAWAGKEVHLVFDGAMADTVVYLNGTQVASHLDGYTPFEVRLTGLLQDGENLLTVKVDGSENPLIPPFGGAIDYLTYAGIYRDAWLRVTPPIYVGNVKIETQDVLEERKGASVRVELANAQGMPPGGMITASIRDDGGRTIATSAAEMAGDRILLGFENLDAIRLWQLQDPCLYSMVVTLETPYGTDETVTRFGFRSAGFTPQGFVLNGVPVKLRGLNRHQAFPYAGYAMGRSAQEADADILKHRLKVNIVRTSHYPQSSYFIDRCDEIGLLVFEEIPGWQHIGGESWKRESVANVGRMITRDWNHPSIVIWGVRINESQDDHDFYAETNAFARELDPTRQTGGVRYLTDSEMLEDVYTMNDFHLGIEELPGRNHPRVALRDQQEVTGLPRKVPYIVTEFNGHMYPTKSYDQEQRQVEHVHRHLQVLDAAYGDPSISGAIGWCMFDYNTHRDFGSGDRICHHGVMDMFREPKFAAYAYASQADVEDGVVMKPVTFWARGERNIGGTIPLLVLTNCDEIELRTSNGLTKTALPDRQAYPHLPHAPVIFDNRHFSEEELGRWGMQWPDATVTGFVGGKAVATMTLSGDPQPTTLEIEPDRTVISSEGRDSVRVMIRALDQAGNKLPFMQDPVAIAVDGPARLVGPSLLPLRGGSTGFWLEATGEPGKIKLTVTNGRFAPAVLELSAE